MIAASTTDASRTGGKLSIPPKMADVRKTALFRCGCAGNLVFGWWERGRSEGKRDLRWGEELGIGKWSFGGKSEMGIFEI